MTQPSLKYGIPILSELAHQSSTVAIYRVFYTIILLFKFRLQVLLDKSNINIDQRNILFAKAKLNTGEVLLYRNRIKSTMARILVI